MGDFAGWKPSTKAVITSLDQLDPLVLSELRSHFESVDPIRVSASQVIGQSDYLQRLDTESSVVSVSSDAGENTVYSYEVPPRLLQTNGAIRVDLAAKLLNNTGATRTVRIKVKYGATTVWDDTSSALSASPNERGFGIWAVLGNAGATNSQKLAGAIGIGSPGSPAAGYGDFTINTVFGDSPFVPIGGTSAEDSTQLKTFAITATLSVADANLTFTKEYAYVTRLSH